MRIRTKRMIHMCAMVSCIALLYYLHEQDVNIIAQTMRSTGVSLAGLSNNSDLPANTYDSYSDDNDLNSGEIQHYGADYNERESSYYKMDNNNISNNISKNIPPTENVSTKKQNAPQKEKRPPSLKVQKKVYVEKLRERESWTGMPVVADPTMVVPGNSENRPEVTRYFVEHCARIKASLTFNVVPPEDNRPYCQCPPPDLIGHLPPINRDKTWKLPELFQQNPDVSPGGHWEPSGCVSRQRVAIVIPYRNRWKNLMHFMHRLHPLLQRQQTFYTIYVVEQREPALFNKGVLMNVGAVKALEDHDFDCFIFHDVDFVPEDDRHMYRCREAPIHFGAYQSRHKYRLRYRALFGSATAFTPQQFRQVNGFSNRYFGWGGEDDDMFYRLVEKNLLLVRESPSVGRMTELKHKRAFNQGLTNKQLKRQHARSVMRKLIYDRRTDKDGLRNIEGTYTQISLNRTLLYTHILVDVIWNGKP